MIDLNLSMVIQLAIVLSLMVILSQVVFKPFLSILQERKNRVERAEKGATEFQQRTEELMENYREAIAAAQVQAAAIREEIRKVSLAKEMEILQKAVEEANRLIQAMKRKINVETETARAGLQFQAQNLSQKIAEKILGRSLQ
jgi:F0F1-type ATP synthase membrane subunit b/b'